MRKANKIEILSMLFMIVVFLGMVTAPVNAQDIQVSVNGQTVQFTDQKPFINKDNRTMVPVRAPMEAAGASVEWNDQDKAATVSQNGISAVFRANSNQYTVNGSVKTMDTNAQIVNGRTCFPIRFVAEALGMQVAWDASTKTVRITGIVNAPDGTAPMSDLTAEAKARLMAYPYPVDKNGKQCKVRHAMGEAKDYFKTLGQSTTDIFEYMREPIKVNNVLKSNQKFISDPDLCYSIEHSIGPVRIRGILQTTNPDGSIYEQDIDYGFFYGTVFVKPGEPTIPSHWFSEYDTAYLSSSVKVK